MLLQSLCVKTFLVCSASVLPMKEIGGQVVKPATEMVESGSAHPTLQDSELRLIIEDSSEVDICSQADLFRNFIRSLFRQLLG